MPEILVKKCPINVLEIVDGEMIKGTLSVKDRSQQSVFKKKVFKDGAKIVTEEFESGE